MRRRRAIGVFLVSVGCLFALGFALSSALQGSLSTTAVDTQKQSTPGAPSSSGGDAGNTSDGAQEKNESMAAPLALDVLNQLEVKGRAPKTGYARTQFGNGWSTVQGCSMRNIILHRDLTDVVLDETCRVVSGLLNDPYTGTEISFTKEKSTDVQIDHVIALSDAWQKGAQNLSKKDRIRLANDPLELLAVSGRENQIKADADAATWLPKNKAFRCTYVARQIAVKVKYSLWVTVAEKEAMARVLEACPTERLIAPVDAL